MSDAYSVLSKLYDKLMVDFDYSKYYEFVAPKIKGNVLELACGSGMFTKEYAGKIDKTIAVDSCREMLNYAVKNNYKDRKYIAFVEADMLEFQPNRAIDTTLCVCDGFNYIDREDIEALISNIYNYMKVDGYLIFDISSEYKINNIIGNNVFYDDSDDYTYLWTNKLHDNYVDMEITIFNRDGEYYRREDENHRQYIHKITDVQALLSNIGFDVNIYDGETFREITGDSRRLLFVARKRQNG